MSGFHVFVHEKKVTDEAVEILSAKLHEIYMKEAGRQGDVRHELDYSKLKESTKEYDRVLARFILAELSLKSSEIAELTTEVLRLSMMGHGDCTAKIGTLQAIIDAKHELQSENSSLKGEVERLKRSREFSIGENKEVNILPCTNCASLEAHLSVALEALKHIKSLAESSCHSLCDEVWKPYGKHDPNCNYDELAEEATEALCLLDWVGK